MISFEKPGSQVEPDNCSLDHNVVSYFTGNHPWHNSVWCKIGWTCTVNDRCVTVIIQQREKKETERWRYTVYPVEGGFKQTCYL